MRPKQPGIPFVFPSILGHFTAQTQVKNQLNPIKKDCAKYPLHLLQIKLLLGLILFPIRYNLLQSATICNNLLQKIKKSFFSPNLQHLQQIKLLLSFSFFQRYNKLQQTYNNLQQGTTGLMGNEKFYPKKVQICKDY